jgi:hypothetical protein
MLGPGWRTSRDRAVAVAGDAAGLHVLAADASDGYAWRTAATLAVRGTDTSQWIGQACMTGDGQRAVVVYAPRQITNDPQAFGEGALAAVVNLSTGAVRQVDTGVSIAYFDPGCGTGETAVLTQGGTGAGLTAAEADSTQLMVLDAATAKITSTVKLPGEVTSAVPWHGGIAAAYGREVLSISSTGQVRALTRTAGPVFRLVPDASGGLGFQVVAGHRVQVHDWTRGRDRLVGTARLGSVELAHSGGRVFVTGPGASRLGTMPSGWRALDVAAGAAISTTGALAVTSAASSQGSRGRSRSAMDPDAARPVSINAEMTGSGRKAAFAVPAAPPTAAAPPPGFFRAGVRHSAARGTAADTSSTTTDPDRTCAVARNDPTIQTYQPSAQQVEWAADEAVRGDLTGNRGPDLYGSGLPAYSPQGIFPPPGLDGGGQVPPQVLLGVMAQESNLDQASNHAIIGQTGNFLPSYNWYGDYSSLILQPGTYVEWEASDCGYGIGQVTTGMCMAGNANCGSNDSPFPYNDQVAVAIDFEANIAAALQILEQKWNDLYSQGIIPNGANPKYIENWWFALWDYNSGMEPDAANGNTTGCTPSPTCTDSGGNWGLGWANNPANMDYPPDRPEFLYPSYISPGGTVYNTAFDLSNPQYWSYEEKVMGFAFYGFTYYNYLDATWEQAFATGQWPLSASGYSQPPYTQFCSQASATNDHCNPSDVLTGQDSDTSDPCQLTGSLADHCWWHWPSTWTTCSSTCGTGVFTYGSGAADPGDPGVPAGYAPQCSSSPLPADAVIVGDTASSIPAPLGCGESWVNNGGTMSWKFAAGADPVSGATVYPSKIDFHQIGAGYSGHFWFTHTIPSKSVNPAGNQPPQSSDAELQVTGTWTPPSTVTGWTRIMVAIPNEGAWDPDANYQISLGNGTTQYRVLNQAWQEDTWLDLGMYNLSASAHVSLSNVTYRGLGYDIAWDAVAFIPAASPSTDYVAMGDSYSAGQGVQPFDPDSDFNYSGMINSCHRSTSGSYPRMVTLPGQSTPIAQQAANPGSKDEFYFTACSGAVTTQLTLNAVDSPPTTYDTNGNTDWGTAQDLYGELPQTDQGWLTSKTSLVTMTIGGNDARFSDVITGCILTLTDCTSPTYELTRNSNGAVDPQPLIDFEPTVIGLVKAHLTAVYDAVSALAPNAEIIVLGYPDLFPANPQSSCLLGLGMSLSSADQAWLNQMGTLLDSTVKSAVTAAAGQGIDIHYVDPSSGFSGHEICSAAPWINGLISWSESGSGLKIPGAGSFHPKLAGQQEYAKLIDGCLAGSVSC